MCPFCGQKLLIAKEDGLFDGKGSKFCPICGLINRKKPKQQRVDETQTLKDKIQKYKEFLIQKESTGYFPVIFYNKFKEIFEQ